MGSIKKVFDPSLISTIRVHLSNTKNFPNIFFYALDLPWRKPASVQPLLRGKTVSEVTSWATQVSSPRTSLPSRCKRSSSPSIPDKSLTIGLEFSIAAVAMTSIKVKNKCYVYTTLITNIVKLVSYFTIWQSFSSKFSRRVEAYVNTLSE